MRIRKSIGFIVLTSCASADAPIIRAEIVDGGAGGASSNSSVSSSSSSSSSSASTGGGGAPACVSCENADGSRLVTRRSVYASDDGFRMVARTFIPFDTLLQETCGAATSEDGVVRCLPSALGSGMDLFFSDAACASTLAHALGTSNTCTANEPKYAIRTIPNADPCQPGVLSVWSFGPKFVGQAYIKTNGACVLSASPNYALYELGSKLSPDMFAPMTVTNEP
jgi:hypothetical protein